MAENEDGQEKTEEATPKRKEEAREKGQVPRSKELTTMAMLLVASVAILIMGEGMIIQLGKIMSLGLDFGREQAFDHWAMLEILQQGISQGIALLLPFMLVMVITAVAAPAALGGWNFSTKSLEFKFDKLNPISGFKRIFAVRGLVELVKALAKFILIGSVGAWLLTGYLPELMGLGRESIENGLAHTGRILSHSFIVLSASLLLIAGLDVPFQLWDHAKNLKMTHQEFKDEGKNTEGKPEVKARIRAMQREISQRRMMADVPNADVIITNPSHYAIALRYDPKTMAAPLVVAKGVELIAGQIRSVAVANKVPLFEAPPLARALYYSTEIDQEVPGGLYLAVAQILAYVFQLKASVHGAPVPERPDDVPVPEDFSQGPGHDTNTSGDVKHPESTTEGD